MRRYRIWDMNTCSFAGWSKTKNQNHVCWENKVYSTSINLHLFFFRSTRKQIKQANRFVERIKNKKRKQKQFFFCTKRINRTWVIIFSWFNRKILPTHIVHIFSKLVPKDIYRMLLSDRDYSIIKNLNMLHNIEP